MIEVLLAAGLKKKYIIEVGVFFLTAYFFVSLSYNPCSCSAALIVNINVL